MSKPPLTKEEIRFIERTNEAATAGLLYEVLHVDPRASTDIIDQAFRDYAVRWHPDKLYHRDLGDYSPMLQDNIRVANEAWKTLCDERKRAAYDRELMASGRMVDPSTASAVTEVNVPSSFEVIVGIVDGKVTPRSSSIAPPEAPRPPRAPSVTDKFKDLLAAQFARAKSYYEAGKAEAAAGRWSNAEGSYYLATRFDPKNPTYMAAHQDAAGKARQARATHFLALADQAESYAKQKEAIEHLRKATECNPTDGAAFFRLGRLLRDSEGDTRGALESFRVALLKDPKNVEWRLAAAELYETLGMRQNAHREARTVLEVDPKNEKARALLKRVG